MFKCDHNIVIFQYPKIFSFGVFDHEGPSKEDMEGSAFSMTFVGTGWAEKSAEPTDIHAEPPNKQLVVRVSGPEPGYIGCSICVIQSALVILREGDKLPSG